MGSRPRGTAEQRSASYNQAHPHRPSAFTYDTDFFSWLYDPEKDEMVCIRPVERKKSRSVESETSDLDSIIMAEKLKGPTARQELIYFFVSLLLDILVESWKGRTCRKMRVKQSLTVSEFNIEEFGEEYGPCEAESSISTTAEYLSEVYNKRAQTLLRDSNTITDSSNEYLPEDEYDSIDERSTTYIPDEEVHFVLRNGAWYKGKVSRRLMHGQGMYFWEDGATFQGDFEEGAATGEGRLEFPDLSVYEGGVYRSFRHGEGLYCLAESPVMYSGQWWFGKKHGTGLILYNDPSKGLNFYRGEWQNGMKEGFGFRQYPSGAKYIGFWSGGKRHGKGVMIWSNNDIYRGEWRDGLMDGYGQYTWNGFINKTLSYPAHNYFSGYWKKGKRKGKGHFEDMYGATIETFWDDNAKEGSGAVICCNGTLVAGERLFHLNKQALFNDKEDKTGLVLREQAYYPKSKKKDDVSNRQSAQQAREHLQAYQASIERAKAISIPIHSPVHSINLCPHTQKYHAKKEEELLNTKKRNFSMINLRLLPDSDIIEVKDSGQLSYDDYCLLSECEAQEENALRNAIVDYLPKIKACYNYYATIACETPPPFDCVLLRLFFWQMLIDCEIVNTSLSLVDIDNLLAEEEYMLIEKPHDPFGKIQLWQFIHILVWLAWFLYGQHIYVKNPLYTGNKISNFIQHFSVNDTRNVLDFCLHYLLEKHFFKGRFESDSFIYNARPTDEKIFENNDLAPMEAMYMIYQKIGEPHSARQFVMSICSKNEESPEEPPIVKYFEKLPYFKIEGKNALTLPGELTFLTDPPPFNYPEQFEMEKEITNNSEKSVLTIFNNLKPRKVIKCLGKACPGIINGDLIINMDYQLTFLEFYKAVIYCTELKLKMEAMDAIRDDILMEYQEKLEEYERKMREYEKMRASILTPSSKKDKSRPRSESVRKDKKSEDEFVSKISVDKKKSKEKVPKPERSLRFSAMEL